MSSGGIGYKSVWISAAQGSGKAYAGFSCGCPHSIRLSGFSGHPCQSLQDQYLRLQKRNQIMSLDTTRQKKVAVELSFYIIARMAIYQRFPCKKQIAKQAAPR
jgi:hypothetical protein